MRHRGVFLVKAGYPISVHHPHVDTSWKILSLGGGLYQTGAITAESRFIFVLLKHVRGGLQHTISNVAQARLRPQLKITFPFLMLGHADRAHQQRKNNMIL